MKIKKTWDQFIFDEMYKRSLLLKYPTYDYKPADETAYPFVEMENTSTEYSPNKSNIRGSVEIRMNVWGLATQRKKVSEMATELINSATTLEGWRLDFNQSYNRLLDDNTTNTPLKRAVLELKLTKI